MDLIPLIPYSWPILRTQCWNWGIREKQPVSLMPGWQVTPRSWLIQSDRSLSLRALTDAEMAVNRNSLRLPLIFYII
ncbi:MAG: hypothetical protein QOG58_2826 [Caballeronia sp.]|nr:hypothetical protein [Caballeronia sp.]